MDAARCGAQLFITGELKHSEIILARQLGLCAICADTLKLKGLCYLIWPEVYKRGWMRYNIRRRFLSAAISE